MMRAGRVGKARPALFCHSFHRTSKTESPVDIPSQPDQLNPTGFDPDFAQPPQWAAMYRACGLQIIPGWAPGEAKGSWKRPYLSEWASLKDVLVPDFTFGRWYGTNGEHVTRWNMGILTGPCSGNVFVLDLDIHKHPEALAWWRELLDAENNGIEPETPEQRTGGGGRQKLFKAPLGWRCPTNRTAIGVDIRGDGGFAVLPPSKHETGLMYEWLPGCGPWEREIEVAPQWLCDAIDMLVEAHGGVPQGRPERT